MTSLTTQDTDSCGPPSGTCPPNKVIWSHEFEGIRYPIFMADEPRKHLQHIKNMKCDADDIFVCSFPKSGTHWVLEIVSMLKRRKATHTDKFNFIDIIPTKDMDDILPPRIFATHLRFNQLPEQARRMRSKVIYCLRNPKDLAVSLFNFTRRNKQLQYGGSWEEFLGDFGQGKVPYSSWFDHVKSWENARELDEKYPMLFVFYEDLQKNPENEIRRISDFLDVDIDSYTMGAILDKTSFESMRSEKCQYHPFPPEVMDPDHNETLYRKGKVGDWKTWFTHAQNQDFDKLFDDKMTGTSLKFKFQLL